MGLAGGGKRWAAHPAAMSVDCGPAMARVRGAGGVGFWGPSRGRKSDLGELRAVLAMPDDVQQRIESIGTVRRKHCAQRGKQVEPHASRGQGLGRTLGRVKRVHPSSILAMLRVARR